MAPAIRLLAAAFLLPILLARTAAGGPDESRDVPHLFGLRGFWKARDSYWLEPTLLAVDLARPMVRPKLDPDGKGTPWPVPVTDVLLVSATEDMDSRLDAFEKGLDASRPPHADFVVEKAWIGSDHSDEELIAPAFDRVSGSRIVLAVGIREGRVAPFHLDFDLRGRYLGIPLISVERARLRPLVHDVRTYLRLMESEGVPSDLWWDVRSIADPEIRYAAVRDVLDASYERTELERQPLPIRIAFAQDLGAAAGASARNRLRAYLLYETRDHAPEVLAAVTGPDLSWWLGLIDDADPVLSDAAFSAASWGAGLKATESIGVALVLAALDRPRGLGQSPASEAQRLLAAAAPVAHVPVDRVKSILRALTGADGREWTKSQAKPGLAELLFALTRVLPDIAALFPSLPEADREAVRAWLKSIALMVPGNAEMLQKAHALFGA